jgi:hypothetical protein
MPKNSIEYFLVTCTALFFQHTSDHLPKTS